jgi:ribosomal protein S27AE
MVEASIEEDIVVENGVACPACGYSFVPPAGSISRFCPACGAPLTLNADAVTDTPPAVMSPEEAQERAARAV